MILRFRRTAEASVVRNYVQLMQVSQSFSPRRSDCSYAGEEPAKIKATTTMYKSPVSDELGFSETQRSFRVIVAMCIGYYLSSVS
jgi:hypothetical protein